MQSCSHQDHHMASTGELFPTGELIPTLSNRPAAQKKSDGNSWDSTCWEVLDGGIVGRCDHAQHAAAHRLRQAGPAGRNKGAGRGGAG